AAVGWPWIRPTARSRRPATCPTTSPGAPVGSRSPCSPVRSASPGGVVRCTSSTRATGPRDRRRRSPTDRSALRTSPRSGTRCSMATTAAAIASTPCRPYPSARSSPVQLELAVGQERAPAGAHVGDEGVESLFEHLELLFEEGEARGGAVLLRRR